MKVICPYCDQPAKLVNGLQVFPHRKDLAKKKYYVCYPCDARVGCHDVSNKPYGPLANAFLREARSACHAVFDPLWKNSFITRDDAYSWMAEVMGISEDEAHIGMMNEEQCYKLLSFCREPGGNPIVKWKAEQEELIWPGHGRNHVLEQHEKYSRYNPPKKMVSQEEIRKIGKQWIDRIKVNLFDKT